MSPINDSVDVQDESVHNPRTNKPNWFAAFWRWHFYGSVIVIPILFILAVTGLTYMYRAQVDAMTHPGVLTVAVPVDAERIALSDQESSVHEAFPERAILSVTDQLGDRATVFATLDGEESRNVYVNPYTGEVTGDLAEGDLLSNLAVNIHGTLLLGEFGDGVIELGASWAIVLAITGYYIFFAGRKIRLRQLKEKAAGAQTKRVHAWVGVIAGVGILFLVVSGLPWTNFWGTYAGNIAASNNDGFWGADPGGTSNLEAAIEKANGSQAPAGWSIAEAPVEESDSHASHNHGNADASSSEGGLSTISIDDAVATAASTGAQGPYFVIYPDGEEGTFTAFAWQWSNNGNPAEHNVSLEKTVYVDQYSGEVVAEYGYANYSLLSKVVAEGIAGHEGRSWGEWNWLNQIVTVAFCLGVIVLCVTGPILWWRRRKGLQGLGAPRGKLPVYSSWGLVVVLVALGIFLPLFGLSLLVVLLLDLLVIRRIPALKRMFGSI
ncbi:MAG: PepSY domain-containing protein [Actinobacteria bacterium]|nr:PepSY domain-containing protein [Actinomycetota bacterium]